MNNAKKQLEDACQGRFNESSWKDSPADLYKKNSIIATLETVADDRILKLVLSIVEKINKNNSDIDRIIEKFKDEACLGDIYKIEIAEKTAEIIELENESDLGCIESQLKFIEILVDLQCIKLKRII